MDYGNLERYKNENKKVLPPKSNENRVLFLGDSITECWVEADPEFFHQNAYIGRGIGGQTSSQTLLRFRQDVIDLKPKVLIINIGTNDIAENTGVYDADFTFGNIVSMVELAKMNYIKVIIASVHPAIIFPWRMELGNASQKISALNERLKAYAKKHEIYYLDYHTALKNEQNGMNPDLAEDGVHPTLKAYKIMEVLVKNAIKATI